MGLNTGVAAPERQRRVQQFYEPYHAELRRHVLTEPCELVLAIHTFTPVYEGARRDVELGVVHCGDLPLARRWRRALAGSGFDVRIDEPYSGANGLMFSADHHARASGRRAIELEIRQDIAGDPVRCAAVADLIAEVADGAG